MKVSLKKIISTTSISLFFLTINISTEAQSLQKQETIDTATSQCYLVKKANKYVQNGQKDKAIAILKQQVAADSQNPALWVNLGRLYQSIGSREQAEKTYNKAIKLAYSAQEPVELTLAMDGLAEVLTSQGKKQEAEQLLIDTNDKINVVESKNPQLKSSSSTCTGQGPCGSCFEGGLTGRCVRMGRGYTCRTSC